MMQASPDTSKLQATVTVGQFWLATLVLVIGLLGAFVNSSNQFAVLQNIVTNQQRQLDKMEAHQDRQDTAIQNFERGQSNIAGQLELLNKQLVWTGDGKPPGKH